MKRNGFAKTAIVIWMSAALLAIAVKGAFEAGFRINETPSVPLGLWRIEMRHRPLRRGDIVSVCPADAPIFRMAFERGYLSRGECPSGLQPMLKPIAATGGDIVSIEPSGIYVNGIFIPNSGTRALDRRGNPMPVLAFGLLSVLPGQVWLVSSAHASSFDSRYFGAFGVADIEGLAHPVWVVK